MASTQRYRPTRSDSYVSTRVFQMGKHQRRFKLYVINFRELCVLLPAHLSILALKSGLDDEVVTVHVARNTLEALALACRLCFLRRIELPPRPTPPRLFIMLVRVHDENFGEDYVLRPEAPQLSVPRHFVQTVPTQRRVEPRRSLLHLSSAAAQS